MVSVCNGRNNVLITRLTSQFTTLDGWPEELKLGRNSLYQYPLSEVVDLVIDNLRKGGNYNDKRVGRFVFRKLQSGEYILTKMIYRTKILPTQSVKNE